MKIIKIIILCIGMPIIGVQKEDNTVISFATGKPRLPLSAAFAVGNVSLTAYGLAQVFKHIPGNKRSALMQGILFTTGFVGLVVNQSFKYKTDQVAPRVPTFKEKAHYTLGLLGDIGLASCLGGTIGAGAIIAPLRLARVLRYNVAFKKNIVNAFYASSIAGSVLLWGGYSQRQPHIILSRGLNELEQAIKDGKERAKRPSFK